jgi:glycosyltransferase involved in cell wall biosynthesis
VINFRLNRKSAAKPEGDDSRIAENIRHFQKTIPKRAVRRYKRPQGWDENIEIVMPCYNHGPYLEAAFKSIQNQTRKLPVKLTIINDASTDNSLQLMRKLKKDNKADWLKVRLINNPKNINQGASLNKAIESSSADLIVIMDSDDMLTPDCLDLIVNTYKKHSDIALLGSQSHWFKDDKHLPKHTVKPINKLMLKKYGPSDVLNFTELNSIQLSHPSLSFFRNAWELVGGYFERPDRVCSFNDRDLEMRICSLLPIGIYPDYQTVFYRTSSSQGKGTI